MLQALLLLGCGVVAHEVLVGAEYAGGLHCPAALWAQQALDHDAASHVEGVAVVA